MDRFSHKKSLNKAMSHHRCARTELIESLWQHPDSLIESGDRLKAKRCVRTTVKLKSDDEIYVVKRYLERSWRHQVKQLFSRSRAEKCWQDTWFLIRHGYPTPTPLAYLEHRLGPLRGSSWYVYGYVHGATLKETASGMKNQRLLRGYVNQLAEIWRIQKRLRVNLSDGHPANFIVDATGKIWVIDLDKLQYFKRRQYHSARLQSSFLETVKGVIGDPTIIRYAERQIAAVLNEKVKIMDAA